MIEKMKPSGIAWIGDIPVGWDIKKIKYVSISPSFRIAGS